MLIAFYYLHEGAIQLCQLRKGFRYLKESGLAIKVYNSVYYGNIGILSWKWVLIFGLKAFLYQVNKIVFLDVVV